MQACRTALVEGLQQLAIPVHEDKVADLLAFIELIRKWNKTFNLTAIKHPEAMVRLHLLDSLAIHDYVQGPRVLDIGAGAGLPGIPLAIYRPEFDFVLLDSNAKKTRFVQQAILELGLHNVTVQHCRVEQFEPENPFNSIASRAFSNLRNFLEVSARLLSDNGALLAMKGQPPEQELQEIDWAYSVYPLKIPGVDAERCLIKLTR